jgi:2-amino-4-hydroxy-6-hydroxymethyldihydropteridine diphosphokinase
MPSDDPNERAQGPSEPPLTVIGIGSNLGDRRATIEAAIEAIARLPGVDVVARSSFWQTTPVGGPPQPDFINAAVAVRTRVPLERLMAELLAIEALFGRVRTERNAPRTLDLDILWAEGTHIEHGPPGRPDLVVPHPRLSERPFALIPLLEIVPGATDPTTGNLYARILAELGTEGVLPLDS